MTVKTMRKNSTLKQEEKRDELKQKVHDLLTNKFASYVLITCSKPSKEGKMNAELTYEGDEILVSYLIDHAMEILSSEEKPTKDFC